MLENVKLHNFKSHQDTELNFDNSRLHALVGQNSSGKPSVLQALHYLSRLANSSFDKIFQHEIAPQFITTIGEDNMSVTASGFWKNPELNNWEASYNWTQKVDRVWYPIASWKADKNQEDRKQMSKTSFLTKEEPIQDRKS